jgi:hypothetical protein
LWLPEEATPHLKGFMFISPDKEQGNWYHGGAVQMLFIGWLPLSTRATLPAPSPKDVE